MLDRNNRISNISNEDAKCDLSQHIDLSLVIGASLANNSKAIFQLLSMKKNAPEDPKEIEQAIDRNTYDNNPQSLDTYSYSPFWLRSLFSNQTELGKPVKSGKKYHNAFFTNLAPVYYLHTYLSGILTCGLQGGLGKQFAASEKKKIKTHIDESGLYQLTNNNKSYIKNGFYRYVVSPKGGLYILTENNTNTFHNSIRASQPVQCAGEVYIKDGYIKEISNASGHYRPTQEQLLRTLGGLYAAGFIKLDARVKSFVIDGFLSYSTEDIGTVKELIKNNIIKLPKPWVATTEFCNKMKF